MQINQQIVPRKQNDILLSHSNNNNNNNNKMFPFPSHLINFIKTVLTLDLSSYCLPQMHTPTPTRTRPHTHQRREHAAAAAVCLRRHWELTWEPVSVCLIIIKDNRHSHALSLSCMHMHTTGGFHGHFKLSCPSLLLSGKNLESPNCRQIRNKRGRMLHWPPATPSHSQHFILFSADSPVMKTASIQEQCESL